MKALLSVVVLAIATGCTYARDRALDVSDVVDLRYGIGFGLAGAKVEVTDYVGIGAGLGFSGTGYEWYGRRQTRAPGGFFAHGVVIGVDDTNIDNMEASLNLCRLGYNWRKNRPPPIDRFRVGVEAFIPIVHLGVYLNTGELVDLFAGFFGADPAEDDGMAKGTFFYLDTYNRERREQGQRSTPEPELRDSAR